ncbi:hypothetical protein MPSEU_000515400 [Mayamaea pseudoterrestris]|nr:hypothetical protein MPSEU_000515400 [Mayamaea pseudoterrestris]
MMQSIALFDSVVVSEEDEWVVLHPSGPTLTEFDDDLTLGEDNSYDYCDDALSIPSTAGIDMQFINDFLGNITYRPAKMQKDMDGKYGDESAVTNNGDQTHEINTLLEDILDTVVASQIRSRLNETSDNQHSRMIMIPTIVNCDVVAEDSAAVADSLGLTVNHETNISYKDHLSTMSPSISVGPNLSPGKVNKSSSDAPLMVEFIGEILDQAAQRSRISNKKRRKRLKLGKKLTATATVTAVGAGPSHIYWTATSSKKHEMALSMNKKQVGTAVQAISIYREEVALSNKKNKKSFR